MTAAKRAVANRVVGDKRPARGAHVVEFPNIPAYDWAAQSVNASPALLKRVAPRESQQTIAGENTVIPLLMGPFRIGARIPTAITYGDHIYLLCVWGYGPIDAIEAVEQYDAELPAGVARVDYLGGAGNVVDPWLQEAFAAAGKAYTQTLPGRAYSVVKVRRGTGLGFPRLVARGRGMKLRSTEFGAPAYTDNAAHMIAEIVTNTSWGLGEKIDWASVTSTAALFDALLGGEKTRRASLVVDAERDINDVLDSLLDQSGCWLPKEGDTYRLVPDVAGASSGTLDKSNIREIASISKRGSRDTPTIVRTWWTDTTARPWKRRSAQVPDSLPAGMPRRVASCERAGILSYSEATRYSTERLNRATLCDVAISGMIVFDPGVTYQIGEIKTVTWEPAAIAARQFRIVASTLTEPGRWSLDLEAYHAGVYSAAIAAPPSLIETPVQSPAYPPAMIGVAAAEQTFGLETGLTASRIRVTWTAPAFAFVRHFRVTVSTGGAVVCSGTAEPTDTEWTTGPLQEGSFYVVSVAIVSSTAAIGTAGTASVTLQGKAIAPGNVASLGGFEAGGRVFLSWPKADNPTNPGTPDPDVWKYAVYYGATGGSLSTATLIDEVDALTYVCETIPAGTWRFYVVAIDSIKQRSATAATRDITVTLDASAYAGISRTFVGPATLTAMSEWSMRPDPRAFWTTDFSDLIGYGHSNTNDAIGTFDDLAATQWPQPHSNGSTAGASAWESESWDSGSVVSGTWIADIAYTVHSGSAAASILLSPTGGVGTWTTYPGTTAKAAGRFVKIRVDCASGSMTIAGYPTITVAQTPRTETVGAVTTLASGGKLVQLAGLYSSARMVGLTPMSATFATAVADRLLVAPSAGLMLAFDLSASGFVFQSLSAGSRTIQAGDYIEFDLFATPTNPSLSASAGIHLSYTDASASGHYSSSAAGAWVAIKTALTAGKTLNGVNFAASPTVAGSYSFLVRNVRITDGAGTTRLSLWTSGEPSQNFTVSASNATNVRMGPANSFLIRAFNASNAQVPIDVFVEFTGAS